MHHQLALPITAQASGTARAELGRWLAALTGSEAAERVRLAASEIISNAVRHASLPEGSTIDVDVDVDAEAVQVRVAQASAATDVGVVRADERGERGGFGLAIVEQVTDRWGVEEGPPGAVWFRVDLP
jgi:anti-sigma regulatory factor (Ser/Thr protein kinase)